MSEWAREDANGRPLIYPDAEGYARYRGERISGEQYLACHPDCGEIYRREESEHAHTNDDGICWHENEDERP